LRLGEEKKKERRRKTKKPQDENIMACPIAQGGIKICKVPLYATFRSNNDKNN